MQLWELLGVRPGVTAFIGGGGKTTMMYTLARELVEQGTVLCITTTRIFPPAHLPVLERVDRGTLERLRCVCVGTPAQETTPVPRGKLSAPAQPIADLAALADWVLVEADGSRGLPLKAHLSHEPVIPPETGRTVVLIGASAFGRPAREVVHRLEMFCQLTGASPDAPVTPEIAASLLKAEALGNMIFVNQAETADAQSAAHRLAEMLKTQLFAGSLQRGEWKCLS